MENKENLENQENQENLVTANDIFEEPGSEGGLQNVTKEDLNAELIKTQNKLQLLDNNLKSAYEKIRLLESERDNKSIRERATDSLITQAVSVFSNTIMLALNNKNNN